MTEEKITCPVCEKGELHPITYSDTFEYHGESLVVDGLEGYECSQCDAEPIFPDQIKRGEAKIADAKRRADGLWEGKEIREARERLGLNQRQAAELFGGGIKAFAKYERGEVIQSTPMDTLIRLASRHPYLLDDIAEIRNVEIPTTEPKPTVSRNSKRVSVKKTWVGDRSMGGLVVMRGIEDSSYTKIGFHGGSGTQKTKAKVIRRETWRKNIA